MAYFCKQLTSPDASGLQTCFSWVEQVTLNDMFGITSVQAAELSVAAVGFFFVMWLLKKLQIYVK